MATGNLHLLTFEFSAAGGMQSGSRVSACDKSIRTAVTSAYFINDNFDLLKLKLTNIASLQAVILSPISIKYTAKVFEGGYQTPSATPSLCSVPSCVGQTWHGRLGDTVNFGELCISLVGSVFQNTREQLLFDEGKRKTLSAKNANRKCSVVQSKETR